MFSNSDGILRGVRATIVPTAPFGEGRRDVTPSDNELFLKCYTSPTRAVFFRLSRQAAYLGEGLRYEDLHNGEPLIVDVAGHDVLNAWRPVKTFDISALEAFSAVVKDSGPGKTVVAISNQGGQRRVFVINDLTKAFQAQQDPIVAAKLVASLREGQVVNVWVPKDSDKDGTIASYMSINYS